MFDFDLDCPNCGGTVKAKLDDFARQRTVRCSRGCNVRLEDADGGAAGAAKAERDLEASLKRFGKTTHLKF